MLYVRINGGKKYFGERLVLELPELTVYEGERIGIVGANGIGKTTLLRILAGELELDEGSLESHCETAFLKQLEDTTSNGSREEESFFRKQLGVRGLENQDCVSGGEQLRLRLANCLAQHAPLLLLDEPTSNLDREGVEWLCNRLSRLDTFVCISHDRSLLTKVCTTIWEVENRKVTSVPGNFAAYEEWKQAKSLRQAKEYEQYSKEKSRLEKLYTEKRLEAERMVKRPRGMTPKEARLRDFLTVSGRNHDGKQKSMNRKADNAAKRIEKLEVKEKPQQLDTMRLDFAKTNPPENRYVLEAKEVCFTYDNGNEVLKNAAFSIQNGKKIGILGNNGAGKTTLLRLIREAVERDHCLEGTGIRVNGGAFSGRLRLVPKAKPTWLEQDLANLRGDKTILENCLHDSVQNPSVVKHCLAGMLFPASTWNKPAKVTSGGERVRLSLVKMLVSDGNMLFLDEPTNYLDLPSLEALEREVKEYEGTVLFVSHDYEFVRHTAEQLLILKEGNVQLFDGTLSEYEQKLKEG